MKRYLLLFLSGITLTLSAQDYYWVGNSGNWSDLSHWATTSGGSELHTEIPDEENDVYIDENSFTLPNQNLTIDGTNAYCRSFNTTGATNSPTITAELYNTALRVYGDFILSDGVLRDFAQIIISSPEDGITVSTAELYLGPNSYLLFGSEEFVEYELSDSVSVNRIGISRGVLNTNGHPIHCTYSIQSNFGPPREMYLSDSKVYLHSLDINSNMVFDADEATFYFENEGNNPAEFNGGDFEFGHVEFDGSYEFTDNNSFNEFIVHAGSELTFDAGTSQSAEQFSFVGTSDEPISIFSNEAGQQATLEQSSGEVNGNFLILRDSEATGGAVFTADNSIDLGNNSGWNIIEDLPTTYYWVDGTGSWTNLSHWATSSGGTEFHSSLPSPQDTVIIDANSFSEIGTVTINTEASMADFRMENVLAGVIIDADEAIHVFGDLVGSAEVDAQFKDIYLDGAPGPYFITSNEMYWGPQSAFIMEAGGNYFINDDLYLQALNVDGGAIVAENITLNMDWQIRTQAVGDVWLDLSGSTVNCNFWRPYDIDPNSYDLEGAVFYCEDQFSGGGLSYGEVYLSGNVSLFSEASFEYLEVEADSDLILESGMTYEVDQMVLMGTVDDPISISASTEGEEAYFEGNMSDVTGTYLELVDNHAVGTATFTAENSTLGNNVQGWNIPESVEELEASIRVYPNPASEYIHIDCDRPLQLMILDQRGKEVFRTDAFVFGRCDINLENLSPGLYTICEVSGLMKPQRFLKQ